MRLPTIPPAFGTWTMSDGYELRGRQWVPRGTARSGILYLHGIQSHGGWYEWSASVLAESGALVLMSDRRGSGLNAAARGDTPSCERWLTDLDELTGWAQDEHGVRQWGVVGVSWGGKLAVAWALRGTRRICRVLLIAPGIFPRVDLSAAEKLRVGWALLVGARERLFDIPLSEPSLFTANPAGRGFIAADAQKLERVTARFLYASRLLDGRLRRIRAGALSAPLTLLLAGQDAIVRNDATRAWVRRVFARVDLRVLEKAAHTMEFEPDVAEFAQALREWGALEDVEIGGGQRDR